jgi:hypothetical protein
MLRSRIVAARDTSPRVTTSSSAIDHRGRSPRKRKKARSTSQI